MLDLNLTTLSLEAGQQHRELPGLYAAAPKKAARLRAADRLVVLLSQASAAPAPSYSPLPPNLQQELVTRLAETYFTSTGSVTAGMKAMAERLNEFLINRNLRQSRQQTAQVVGLLNMAVVHGSYIYIAQAGPMHAYLINGDKVEHFTDTGGQGRGLGLARLVSLRFFQAEVVPGSSLILTLDPPAGWKEAGLRAAAGLELDPMRTALIGDALNLEGALVRFSAGRGDVRMILPVIPQRAVPVEPAAGPAAPLTPNAKTAESAAPVDNTPQGIYLSGKALGDPPAAAPQKSAPAQLDPDRVEPVLGRDADQRQTLPELLPDSTAAEPLSEIPTPVQADSRPSEDIPPWEETLPTPVFELGEPAVSKPTPEPERPLSGAERAVRRAAQTQAGRAQAADARSAPAQPEPPLSSQPAPATNVQPASARADSAPSRDTAVPRRERAQRVPSAAAAGAARAAGGAIGGLRKAGAWVGGAINRLVARALPDQPTEGIRLSSSTMLFIALAVPVLVVAVSATVYFQRGRGQVHDVAVQTAQQFADRAATQGDRTLQREDWNQAMTWLDRAQNYGSSEESDALRGRVQAGLDSLDGLTRLEFRPALGGTLGEGVQISRMIPVVNDIYLLDAAQGRVLRAYRSGQGYEIDPAFACSAGDYGGGSVTVGPLVDITTLPGQNFLHAVILAIDARGHVLLCQPGEIPSAQTLEPPDVNWGTLTRAVHLQGVLYVLDTQMNQVYRYFFSEENANFVGAPGIYFDLQVPRLADVIDLAADQEYLYLLHADGSMTSCSSTGASTQCADPAPYGDPRDGWAGDPLRYEDAAFTLIQSTQPPDPSLYILDTLGPSIYNFSHRRLNLQRLYRPITATGYPPEGKTPQSFVITANRRVVLAVDNQLFMATLP